MAKKIEAQQPVSDSLDQYDYLAMLEKFAGASFSPEDFGADGVEDQITEVCSTFWTGVGFRDFASLNLKLSPYGEPTPTWTLSHDDLKFSLSLSPDKQITFASWNQPVSEDEVFPLLKHFGLPDNLSDLQELLASPKQTALTITESMNKLENQKYTN